ncbi:MAG: phospholipase D-like domain-containing protein [Firmicutes bacterium]|nr:phospholipase D-like domain-containing protein [Bacillota bacterium]
MNIGDMNLMHSVRMTDIQNPPQIMAKKPKPKEAEDKVELSDMKSLPPKYEMTDGNYVEPLETGGGKDQIVPKLVGMIEGADTAVQVQMYRLGHNKIVDVLADQARHGVKVQVLLDPSDGYNEADAVDQKRIQDYLTKSGVEILKYPIEGPAGKIDHVKMLIVDGNSLLIGGMNWDQHSPTNKDFDVFIRGPVVGQARDVFNNDWNLAGGHEIPGLPAPKPQPDANAQVRMATTEVDRKDINTVLQDNINKAQKSIKMEAFSLADKTTIANLIAAKERGVDVRVILDPNKPIAFVNKKSADQLAAHGIDVKWRKVDVEQREKLHAKLAMFDDDKVILGSCNFTHNGLEVNHEADVEVISKSVGRGFNTLFDEHWQNESVDKMPFLADYNETVDSAPVKQQMGKELFRYATEVYHTGKKRNWTGKNKEAVLDAIEKYDKTKQPANPETLFKNSGNPEEIDLGQEMEVVGDLSSFVNDIPGFKMNPQPGDTTPLYDARLKICETAAKDLPGRIPKLIDDMVASIQDPQIKAFTKEALSKAPEGFFKAPSSATGKYHPADEVDPADMNTDTNAKAEYPKYGGGGLVLHSRRVQSMAEKLCDHYGVKGKEKDEMLCAMALHDVMKGVTMEDMKAGVEDSKSIVWNKTTTPNHGEVAAEWIKAIDPTGGKMTKNIQNLVANHMSIWNDPEPTPPKDIRNFIASMSDYTVSQNNFYLDV